MKIVRLYQTSDGELHTTYEAAKNHADRHYNDALLRLTHKLQQLEKHTEKAEFINANLSEFTALATLKDDRIIISKEEED